MIVVLDTGVLGGIANPKPKSPTVQTVITWAAQMRLAGHIFAIPAIAVYEIRRELLRNNATASVTSLDTFANASTNIYLSITDAHLNRAAQLWATVRQAGKPTASDPALDGDVILMAQALEAGYTDYIVATTNLKHFQPWVKAEDWQKIVP